MYIEKPFCFSVCKSKGKMKYSQSTYISVSFCNGKIISFFQKLGISGINGYRYREQGNYLALMHYLALVQLL